MSELANNCIRHGLQRHLLSTVSAAALMIAVSVSQAEAASTFLTDTDKPSLWIELGGHVEQVDGGQETWMPVFERSGTDGFIDGSEQANLQKRQRLQFGFDGKISFQPQGSDWSVAASFRYGRGQRAEKFHQSSGALYYAFRPFLDTHARNVEDHAIIDFQVGKDVGLGMIGPHGKSTVAIGLRIAQFNSDLRSFATASPTATGFRQHRYTEKGQIDRSSTAFGPSLAWNASVPIAAPDSGLSLDLGANAAVLFGRQKVRGHLATQFVYYNGVYPRPTSYNVSNPSRRRNVVTPNIGGTFGFSYHLPAAKLSIGYRADIFFNAIDGGIATRQTYNRSFYGPFAMVSVGLGG